MASDDGAPILKSPLPPALRWAGPALAAAYGIGGKLHRAVSHARTAPLPVVCIGNLTAGGTGKTPAVIYFAQGLLERGRKPAVLLRGYKAQASDEALEIERSLGATVPVIVNSDRFSGTLEAARRGCDVALLDDGFQHWKLQRDLDIVLIDATDPFGGGALLPQGRLREKPSELKRAGAVILTRSDCVAPARRAEISDRLRALASSAVFTTARHVPTRLRDLMTGEIQPLERLKRTKIAAACGIGNPLGFAATLAALGAEVAAFERFDDHHAFTAADIAAIVKTAVDQRASAVIVTAKDAVKIAGLRINPAIPFLVLEVRFTIEDADKIWCAIEKAIRAHAPESTQPQ